MRYFESGLDLNVVDSILRTIVEDGSSDPFGNFENHFNPVFHYRDKSDEESFYISETLQDGKVLLKPLTDVRNVWFKIAKCLEDSILDVCGGLGFTNNYISFCFVKSDNTLGGNVLGLNPASETQKLEVLNRVPEFRKRTYRLLTAFLMGKEDGKKIDNYIPEPIVLCAGATRLWQKVCKAEDFSKVAVCHVRHSLTEENVIEGALVSKRGEVIQHVFSAQKDAIGFELRSFKTLLANPESFAIIYIPSVCEIENRTGLQIGVEITNDNIRRVIRLLSELVFVTRSWGLAIERQLLAARIRSNFIVQKRRLQEAYTQSAIAAIMSRNGSHNIGSHVLSALTHNVGTMPDDRVLYQYIQHRMDYIATATTGFPDWGVPTMFVGEIMRNFMTQHHLLDYIVESEGLHAYHFQGHKAIPSENEKNTLRLKIVAKVGSEHRPFVDYGEGDIKQDVPLSDVCVSIPGGVAGHHAVYTILENVIRNAAKHGWARPDKRQSLDNLEVTVEFEDVPKDDRVLVTVYDNAPLPDEEAGKLVHSLNAKLKEKLISEETDGALRKENWGLAEMRISAAYLQQRTLPETGGLSELKDGDHIISAAVIKNGDDGRSHLGYQFFIRKPQEMLIVIPCSWKDVIKNLKANRGTAAKILALSGIRTAECKDDECFDIITGNKLQSFRYAYVVLPRQPKRQLLRSGAYPFRLLVLGGSGSLVWKSPMKKGVYDRYDREPIGSRMLPSLSLYVKEIRKLLQEVGGKSADDNCTSGFNGVDKAAFDLRTIVYNVWIQYLDKRTRTLVKLKKCDGECLRDSGKRDLNIYIDTEGGESNSGRELLSDRDVCIYLLDHSYRTILEALNKVIGKEVEKIESTEEKEAVQHQVASLFDGLEKVCFDKSTLGYDMHVRDMMRQVADQVLTLAKVGDLLEDLKRQGFNIRESLIDFLVGAFSATDAMLRKYSERIDTLPKHFCVGASTGSQKPKDKDGCDVLDGVKVISKIKAGTDKGSQDCTITYQRHAGDAIRNVYASGLSGSQSCFSQFKRFEADCNVQNKQSMLARLVENALLRILIIDERVFKFLSIRPRSLSKLSRMNVWAVNTNMTQSEESGGEGKTESTKETCDVKDGGNHKTRSCLTVNWDHWKRVNEDGKGEAAGCQQLLPAGVFDVLVIHQGIIDKVLGNKCTKKQVELMLERLKKVVPYVVITTGRGRPTNTPASARILPFSCVERYLFQEWPEKFLLVNAIMNLLPCGE